MTHARFDIASYLSVLPLFGELAPDLLERVAHAGCGLERLERGAMLFAAGERCEAFHMVLTGHLKIYAIADSGAEKVFELAGPGQPIGELCMFNAGQQRLNAQALTSALLLRIPRAAVMELILHQPAFALRMLAGASQRVQGLQRDLESCCLHSGLRRVVGYLLEHHATASSRSPRPGPITVSLPVSKAAIAARLSLTPEYFSRVLRELEDAGLINVARRDIHIPDTQRLAHYSRIAA
ncbi:UNVERIFIED_ORG: Crp/Fnr family transcriptional regulator [Shinella sp. XGS7]|nr:Crp/Fnr family transcriptional regulator [Shinella sp. XGS7]